VADLVEIQHDIDFGGLMQGMQPVTQFQISMTQSEWAFQIENDNAFAFPLFDLQTHTQPTLAQTVSDRAWFFGGAVCIACAKSTVSHRRGSGELGLFRGFRLSIPMNTLQQPAREAFSTNPGRRYAGTSTCIGNSIAMPSSRRIAISASRILPDAGFRAKLSSVKNMRRMPGSRYACRMAAVTHSGDR
jgi:hypothetical protein